MRINIWLFISIFYALHSIWGCTCKENCAIPVNRKKKFKLMNAQAIVLFKNAMGQTITWNKTDSLLTDDYQVKGKVQTFGCYYDPKCENDQRYRYQADVTIGGLNTIENGLSYEFTSSNKIKNKVYFKIFDFDLSISNDFVNDTELLDWKKNCDSIVTQFTIQGFVYDTLYVFKHDQGYYKNIIYNVMISDSIGIVGFSDSNSHTTYLRQ